MYIQTNMEDNIDFLLTLRKHGWTDFLLDINGVSHRIVISSVLSSPMYDITNMLLALLNNEDEIILEWFEEPGWSILRVTREKTERHIISMELGSADDQYGAGYKKIVTFEIQLKQLLVTLFYQLKKAYHLLTQKGFAKEREEEFPYERYRILLEKIKVDFPGIL